MLSLPAFCWCLISSLLYWLCFFPVNAGWLGWIALVPLGWVLQQYIMTGSPPLQGGVGGGADQASTLHASTPPNLPLSRRGTNTRWFHRPLLAAWLGGLAFCLMAFRWICLASAPMIAVYIVLSLIISLQWYLFFLFTRIVHLRLRLPWFLAGAIVWTALEYIRSQIYIGYSWYSLGHTQHEEVMLTQCADLAGVYGLSFIVMLVNLSLARVTLKRTLATVCWELVPAVILVGLASWYGFVQLQSDAANLTPPQTPRIAILQGNQPQDLRNDPEKWRTIDVTYFNLGEAAVRYRPELIIAPETCLSFSWIRMDGDVVPEFAARKFPEFPWDRMVQNCRAWLKFHTERWNTDLLFGFNTFDLHHNNIKHTNSAILFLKNGKEAGIYDKIVCLPFGEYIPLAETLPFMKLLSPYKYEYTIQPGTELTTLSWREYRIAPLVCYEDSVHDQCRNFVRLHHPHFFVNMSNDGWFKGSEEHEQHLVNARFRCIENRRSMVRSVNMGISCIIDPLGRVIALPATVPPRPDDKGAIPAVDLKGSEWRQAKDREGILIGSVPLSDETSIYTRYGDVLPWACWVVMIAGVVFNLLRRKV
ncbi:MAG: apolipoprotein N-acyltransferase [Gemmatales bacterium]